MAESKLQGNGGFGGSPEPMREDQILNAVNFLWHPRIRGSPAAQRRSFLENKGLTKDEIDEAFRRVPDPPPLPKATNSPSPDTNQGLETPVTQSPNLGQVGHSRFNINNALIAFAILSSTVAGATILCKKSLIPRLKLWIQKVVEEEERDLNSKKGEDVKLSLNKEVMEAIKMASSAADQAVRATEELQNARKEDKKHMEVMMDMINSKVEEMKSIGKSIRMIHFSNEVFSREVDKSWTGANKPNSSFTPIKQINGTSNREAQSVKPPSKDEPTMAPHPESYMEIIEMIQRGERPPNIKDIDDMPPDPNRPIPKPRMAPKPKPWEVNMPHQKPISILQSQFNSQDENPNLQYNANNVTSGTNDEVIHEV